MFRRELTRWLLPPDGSFDDGFPLTLRIVEWLVDLHNNLLAGSVGRDINGTFAILLMVMVRTGAVIWWPLRRTRHSHSLGRPRPPAGDTLLHGFRGLVEADADDRAVRRRPGTPT